MVAQLSIAGEVVGFDLALGALRDRQVNLDGRLVRHLGIALRAGHLEGADIGAGLALLGVGRQGEENGKRGDKGIVVHGDLQE